MTTTPPVVTLDHWMAHRVASGDTIERWSIEHQGRTLLTFETEFEARHACRQHNWPVAEMTESGWITPQPDPAHRRPAAETGEG